MSRIEILNEIKTSFNTLKIYNQLEFCKQLSIYLKTPVTIENFESIIISLKKDDLIKINTIIKSKEYHLLQNNTLSNVVSFLTPTQISNLSKITKNIRKNIHQQVLPPIQKIQIKDNTSIQLLLKMFRIKELEIIIDDKMIDLNKIIPHLSNLNQLNTLVIIINVSNPTISTFLSNLNIPSLKILNVHINFKNTYIQYLCNSFQYLNNIEQLSLRDTIIDNNMYLILANSFHYLNNLKKLDLSYTNVNDIVCTYLFEKLQTFSKLEHLDIEGNKMSDSSFLEFSKYTFKHLKYLNLSYDIYISEQQVLAMSSNDLGKNTFIYFLQHMKKLKILKLGYINLSKNNIKRLSTILTEHLSDLEELSIEGNHLNHSDTFQTLCNSLKYLNKLKTLNFNNCLIKNDYIPYITNSLVYLKNLENLFLTSNYINDNVKLLIETLASIQNSKLKQLFLDDNNITDSSMLSFYQYLPILKNLKDLRLDGNRIRYKKTFCYLLETISTECSDCKLNTLSFEFLFIDNFNDIKPDGLHSTFNILFNLLQSHKIKQFFYGESELITPTILNSIYHFI